MARQAIPKIRSATLAYAIGAGKVVLAQGKRRRSKGRRGQVHVLVDEQRAGVTKGTKGVVVLYGRKMGRALMSVGEVNELELVSTAKYGGKGVALLGAKQSMNDAATLLRREPVGRVANVIVRQAPKKAVKQTRGTIIEHLDDEMECWVQLAPQTLVRTALPAHLFAGSSARPGQEFTLRHTSWEDWSDATVELTPMPNLKMSIADEVQLLKDRFRERYLPRLTVEGPQ